MSAPASTTRKGPKRLQIAKGYRFSCRRCGDCCRHAPVTLTAAEVARYDARDWAPILGAPVVSIHERAVHDGVYGEFMRRRPDGACIMLGADSLCAIHTHLGEAEKPLTCRLYPYTFTGATEGKAIASATFGCSSIAAGDGDPLPNRRKALEGLLEEVEQERPVAPPDGPITFHGGLRYARADVERVLDLLVRELEDAGRPLPERLVAAAKFTSLLAGSRFPTLEGETPRKLVDAFAAGINDQAQRGLLRVPGGPPPLPEKILFRQVLAFAARRDPATLLTAGTLRRLARRFGNLLAGLTFMAGNGVVQPIGRDRRVALGDVRRSAPPADLSSPEADGALTRYLVGHLSSRTILDRTFAVPELLPALGLLFRQVPMALLFARAACLARGGDRVERDDWASALRTADWNFGRVPWTAGPIGRVRARVFADVEASFGHLVWCAGRPVEPAPAGAAP